MTDKSAAPGGNTLTPCAIVLAGTLGPLGRSRDEHLIGKGGLERDLIDAAGLLGGTIFDVVSVGVEVTGLAGCDRVCSGAWNVYTVKGGL